MTNENKSEIVWIDINHLHPHPDNPRKDLGDLTELSESIKAKGILQNLTVICGHHLTDDEYKTLNEEYNKNPSEELRMKINSRKSDEDYTVIIGHRRTAAAKLAGLAQLPCIIAEMSYPDQIQTMLLENMQRSELTAFEQALGFQMMFDFGNSVEDISDKTGFSQTTVRRRLKLAELDRDKLKKASSRQISLLDFDRLSKIEDIAERNKLLDSIGTNNFDRDIKSAIEKQEQIKRDDEWRSELKKKGLKEINYNERYNGRYALCKRNFVNMKSISAKDYMLSGDEEYFCIFYGTVYFNRKRTKEECSADYEAERKRNENRQKKDLLDEAEERAYLLRRDFVTGITEAKAKENIKILIEYEIRNHRDNRISGYYRENYDNSLFTGDVIESSITSPYQTLLKHIYAELGDTSNLGYSNFNGHFTENKKLDLIYDYLEALGYEPSDEEQELRGGTSKLFLGESDGN